MFRKLILSLFVCTIFCLEGTESPVIVQQQFIYTEAPYPSCHASTITEIQPGVLLASWFGGSKEGANDVGIWISQFLHGKWSTPMQVAKEPETPCWNPVLFTMPSGEILLFYKAGPSPRNWTGYLKRSLDGGNSWSASERLPPGVLGPIKNKPLLLDNQTQVCGSSIESWQANGCWVEITRDGGRTWQKQGPIYLKDPNLGMIQPALYYGPNQELHMLCRPRQGLKKLCKSTSKDGGMTWSEVEITTIPNPDSGVDTVNLDENQVVLVYNPVEKGRRTLAVALSSDGGITWQEMLTLEKSDKGEYSYPAVIRTQDGLIHVTYTWNRTRIKHVVLSLK